jgi:hypothetical protein
MYKFYGENYYLDITGWCLNSALVLLCCALASYCNAENGLCCPHQFEGTVL